MRRRSRKGEDEVDRLAVHLLGAVRPGIDVAVHAGLVAAVAEIDLQRVEPAAAGGQERTGSSEGGQMCRACGGHHKVASVDNCATLVTNAAAPSPSGADKRTHRL